MRTTIFSQSNEGLTFVWMPQLFATLPVRSVLHGHFLPGARLRRHHVLISMAELATRALVDAGRDARQGGADRRRGGVSLGLPAVIWLPFLRNQDWVWGVA